MLAGKLAIVTGATSGIGAATARLFAREGASVLATGRNRSALAALQAEGFKTVEADLTEPGACERVISDGVAALGGRLTTLVNCAGVLRLGAFGAVDPSKAAGLEDFEHNFAVNTHAPFKLMVHAIPHLKAAGPAAGPSIVNVSSVNGLQSFGGTTTYCASKAALDMLTRCAAVDLGPYGVRVNAVNPGVVITELQKRGGMNDEQYAALVKRSIEVTHPLGQALGRVAESDEVANLIAFLASDRAAFITGDSVKIDGGRTCVGAR
eukprot:TRINITY_DN32578_c0_g1_i1.p1 TRINITY_DN32578_c0_g1~~TRINITY_DN32578_c0_g1_i1.p1  ORF type:complete len:265 (+),score=50.25 TRINITY_DN32578_c0_g1_i1:57-851(+)